MRNKYHFVKDDKCITLYKRSTVKKKDSKNYGEEVDVILGHYGDLNHLLKKLVFLELIDSGSVQDLFADLKVVIPSVRSLLK